MPLSYEGSWFQFPQKKPLVLKYSLIVYSGKMKERKIRRAIGR
jgi:hypothetical protein